MDLKITELKPFGVLILPGQTKKNLYDLDRKKLFELFYSHHLVILRGFSSFESSDDFADYCALWGEISLWPFGKVLELKEQKKPEDHIFDSSYMPLHWDGMYRHQVPEMQIFHCALAPRGDEGGRTTFSNTVMALENAKDHERKLWSRVTGVYERRMAFYNSKTEAPIITKHPTRGFPVIRYCEATLEEDKNFVNHPKIEFKGLKQSKVLDFHLGLQKVLYDEKNFYAHSWQTGDVVFADNHTLLHGREAFCKGAPRHLRRVHVLGETLEKNPHLVFHS